MSRSCRSPQKYVTARQGNSDTIEYPTPASELPVKLMSERLINGRNPPNSTLPSCCDNPKPVVLLCGGKHSAMNAGSGAMIIAVNTASNATSSVTAAQPPASAFVLMPAN